MPDQGTIIRRSFFQCWFKAGWLVILGIAIGATTRVLMLKAEPRVFISLAKLSLKSRPVANRPMPGADSDSLMEIKKAVIQWMESAEMRERALQTLKTRSRFNGEALEPRFGGLRIEVPDSPDSAILTIRGFGGEPQTTRLFLDTVLDEFMYSLDAASMKNPALANVRFAIEERASGTIEDVRELALPGFLFGMVGGLYGFALSLCLAGWFFKKTRREVSPDQEQPIRSVMRESFYQTSSRFSGLVVIGISLGASIQLLRLGDDEPKTFLAEKLRVESLSGVFDEGDHSKWMAKTISTATSSLTSEQMIARAEGRVRFLFPRRETGAVQIEVLPDTDSSILELQVSGAAQEDAQIFLETLVGEFNHVHEPDGYRLSAAEPPSWTTLKPQGKSLPIAIGAMVGGFAGFSLALLIAALIRAVRGPARLPPLPAAE